MLFDDARGNQVTAASAAAAAHLDETVRAYLGFRGDTGDRLKAALAADPDCAMAHCLRGYFMMLFGQRAMVPRARRSLEAATQAAGSSGATEREAAHMAALAVWVAGDFAGATSRWEAPDGAIPARPAGAETGPIRVFLCRRERADARCRRARPAALGPG